MQKSHREEPLLPAEWRGLQWARWQRPGVALPGDADWLLGPGPPFSPNWEWTGGAFTSGGDVTIYDPVPLAAEIFDDALRVNPDSTEDLLDFVRRWGILGVGSGLADDTAHLAAHPQARPIADTVWATQRALRETQRHFRWLLALQDRQWRSPAIPSLWSDEQGCFDAARFLFAPPSQGCLDAARSLVAPPDQNVLAPGAAGADPRPPLVRIASFGGGDPYLESFAKGQRLAWWSRHHARPRDRHQAHWGALAAALTPHLRLVHPMLRWIADRPAAGWHARRLVDLLWVRLWNLAGAGVQLRPCRHCRKWFPVDHQGKVYCSRICTNRASAAASYAARKKLTTRRRSS